jgi:hypothetical protein
VQAALRLTFNTEGRSAMAKFITIGYGDEGGYERTTPELRDAAHAHDARLQAAGVLMAIAGAPVQVRNTNAEGIATVPKAYMRSDLPVAGFAVIEADTIDDAIALVAPTPCAVAHGVVEVWPLLEVASGSPATRS